MINVLILTVGGSPEPVINAINQNQPEFVYFICTTGNEERASEKMVPDITKQSGLDETQYQVFCVENPDILNEILTTCEKIELAIQEQYNHPVKVIANYTGGTKTMSLGLGVYALQRAPEWDVQVNSGPRSDLIKIKFGDNPQLLDLTTFFYQKIQNELNQYEQAHNYEGAVLLLNPFLAKTTLPQVTLDKLRYQQYRFIMLSAWDRFDYPEAIQYADLINDDTAEEKYKKLRRISDFFADDSNQEWKIKDVSGHELVEDLIDNAKRCAERNRFDDAIGRLYRATELLAQIRLLRDYSIKTGNVKLDTPILKQKSKEWLQKKDARKGIYKIGLMENKGLCPEHARCPLRLLL